MFVWDMVCGTQEILNANRHDSAATSPSGMPVPYHCMGILRTCCAQHCHLAHSIERWHISQHATCRCHQALTTHQRTIHALPCAQTHTLLHLDAPIHFTCGLHSIHRHRECLEQMPSDDTSAKLEHGGCTSGESNSTAQKCLHANMVMAFIFTINSIGPGRYRCTTLLGKRSASNTSV